MCQSLCSKTKVIGKNFNIATTPLHGHGEFKVPVEENHVRSTWIGKPECILDLEKTSESHYNSQNWKKRFGCLTFPADFIA
jgi:hypothetical protein